jgi:hypothetical protein
VAARPDPNAYKQKKKHDNLPSNKGEFVHTMLTSLIL